MKGIWKTLNLAAKICVIVFVFLFGIAMIGGTIMFENEAAVNTVFKAKTQEIYEDPDAASKDSEYFKTAFGSVAEVKANGEVYAETIVAEGATLLKNENGCRLSSGSPGWHSSLAKSMLRRCTRAGVPVLNRRSGKPSRTRSSVRAVAAWEPSGPPA